MLTKEDMEELATVIQQLMEFKFNDLNDWEQSFCQSLAEKFETYHEKTFLSFRQEGAIRKLQKKYLVA